MLDRCPACNASLDVLSAALTVVACPSCKAPLLASPGAATAAGAFPELDNIRSTAVQLPAEFEKSYKVLSQLGSGAMGTVMLAESRATGEQLAIKFLLRNDDPQQLKRFMREGKLMAALQHPHVVRVYEIGEIAGHAYLACEYVPGGSLRDLLKTGRVEMGRALKLMADAFEGLAVCHEAEIVHRDLKPENILIDATGRAKLADLGIARDTASSGGTLTKTGTLIGTPLYMSPEQIAGDRGSTATDLYSLGLVLYEILVGSNPIAAPTLQEVFRRQCDLVPRTLDELGIAAPAGISGMVAQLLEKDAELRPKSATEVARTLRAAAASLAVAAASGAHLLNKSSGRIKVGSGPQPVAASGVVSRPPRVAGEQGPASRAPRSSGPAARARASGAPPRSSGISSLPVGAPGESGDRIRLALVLATAMGLLLLGVLHLRRGQPSGTAVTTVPSTAVSALTAVTEAASLPILDFRVRTLESALLVHCRTPRPARVRAAAVEEGSDGAVKASDATTTPAYVHRLYLQNLRPSVSYRVHLDSLVGDPPVRFAPRLVRTIAQGERARAEQAAHIAGESHQLLGGRGGIKSAQSWTDLFTLRRWGTPRDVAVVVNRLKRADDWEDWREGLTILRWIGAPEAAVTIARGLALHGPGDDPETKVREAIKALESAGGVTATEALSAFLTQGLADATPAQAKWRDWLRLRAARALWKVDPERAADRFRELALGAEHAPLALVAGAMTGQSWAYDLAEKTLAEPPGPGKERGVSAAVAALARLGGARGRAGLERALQRGDLSGWARGAAADGLATWGSDDSVPLLIKELAALAALGTSSWWQQATAARALAACAHRSAPGPRKLAALALAGALAKAPPEPVRRALYRGLGLLGEPDAAPALEADWSARRTPVAELALALAASRSGSAPAALDACLSGNKATDLLLAALANAKLAPDARQSPRVRAAVAALSSPFARERLTALCDALDRDPTLADSGWLEMSGPWALVARDLPAGEALQFTHYGFTAYRVATGAVPEVEASPERGVDLFAPEGRNAGITELRRGGVNGRIGAHELAQPLMPDVSYTTQLPGDLYVRVMSDEFGEADDLEIWHPEPIPAWQYTGLVITRVERRR